MLNNEKFDTQRHWSPQLTKYKPFMNPTTGSVRPPFSSSQCKHSFHSTVSSWHHRTPSPKLMPYVFHQPLPSSWRYVPSRLFLSAIEAVRTQTRTWQWLIRHPLDHSEKISLCWEALTDGVCPWYHFQAVLYLPRILLSRMWFCPWWPEKVFMKEDIHESIDVAHMWKNHTTNESDRNLHQYLPSIDRSNSL